VLRDRKWALGLVVVAVAALVLRIAYVLLTKNPRYLGGDDFYYHHGANLLVDGEGFVDPIQLLRFHHRTPGAVHPPGYIVALAIPSLFGFRSVLDHQIWSCVIGAGTIVLVGIAGREIAGPRVGLVAAALAAVYPNIWFSDSVVMSETLVIFTTALTIVVAYRFAKRATMWLAAGLGVAVGFTALTRAESILLVPLLVVPLALVLRALTVRRRLELLAVSVGATLLTIAPWIGYNLVRFEHPVFLSSNLEHTLLSANCDPMYHGPFIGFFSLACGSRFTPPKGDESVQERFYRDKVGDYVSDHESRVPVVILARLGRTWGLFNVNQQMTIDTIEGRELNLSRVGLGMFYAFVAAGVVGAIALRRRRVPLTPLLAVIAAVALTVAVVYGTTRFRAPAEVPLVLLGAVGLDVAARRAVAAVRNRRAHRGGSPTQERSVSLARAETRALRILRAS
jgi:4-amino-4-deoxy-L-arabinose transferase-like glycosyltransferase